MELNFTKRRASSDTKVNYVKQKRRKSLDLLLQKQRKSACDSSGIDDPPVLNITFTGNEEVNEPVHRRSKQEYKREFACEAEAAVKSQIDNRDGNCCRIPPNNMNPGDILEAFKKVKNESYPGKYFASKDLPGEYSGESGFILFVIRRPGCKLCREQALYLKFLFQNHPKEVQGFNIIGVVKEFCDSGKSLHDFHENYFPFPIFHDDKKTVYKALGSRRVSLSTTLKIMNPFSDVMKRIKKNDIKGNFAGDGFLQGGVIVFKTDGEPAFKYEEKTGFELPVSDIVIALEQVRQGESFNENKIDRCI